ncbi:phage terminase small subunit [Clostridium sp. FS41]|uniref:phage terminase small subunit n=1 Tax=Clostridium sp. FS41 TaxID=1609975 RepID=UPI0005D2D36B|nr:phage terminase small subunit [Clostridium sp. FS41]KJJ66692.1 phage terminase small subunit [Clostridium sp. FS41]
MPRGRSPNRDKAFEIYKQHGGKITNREIAARLDEDEKVIAVWKNRDKWNVVQQKKKERCTTKSRGGQPGNKNAVGHGGTGPPGNKNAVKHGAYEQIYYEALPEEEQSLFDSIPDSDDLNGEIRLLRLKLSRLISRGDITTFDMFGGAHTREITEAEREKGILEITAELRKLIKTKKQLELAVLKAGGGEPDETDDDGFMEALAGTAAEDWTDEE